MSGASASLPVESDAGMHALLERPLDELMREAASLAHEGFGSRVSYSRKVFIPLTQLCRDVCGYCTFARAPRPGERAFLSPEQVLEIARTGARAGCREALFTLGDKPELRHAIARRDLDALGFGSTLDYLGHCAALVLRETGLLPHLNAGLLDAPALARLRPVAVSMGLMLESASPRLLQRGGPHHRAPDKDPVLRLESIRLAGEAHVAFTTGLLVGIGETRRERLESLLALRALHERYAHLQELIIQNFRAKPRTRMAGAPDAPLEELLWTVAVARLLFGPQMSIQAPPNLSPEALGALLEAGINDWGGVSPVTPDYVNPEAPWPHLASLAATTRAHGRELVERLAIAPRHAREPERWLDAALRPAVRRALDAAGYVREGTWHAGAGVSPDAADAALATAAVEPGAHMMRKGDELGALLRSLAEGRGEPTESQIARLFELRGSEAVRVLRHADALRAEVNGVAVTYVVNRNINYTNICSFRCGFCAFSKGRSARSLRGAAYDLDLAEIERRVLEAEARGATEVCMQGGIHPSYTGATYLGIVRVARRVAPRLHLHAFSPLEIHHGATTLGVSLEEYLRELRRAGLDTLPGTAAEILDDEVRQVICPDKLDSARWLEVMRAAHRVGLRSTATIMFGHVDEPRHWARHLLAIRNLQRETGGFTEFVPLPFVHMEAPLWRQGRARSGPTFRESLLMHAVARLALHPLLTNVQASWVKLGLDGALLALRAGANDLGGVLMDESITRAAGGVNGQQLGAAQMCDAIGSIGREPRQRTTLYANAASGPAPARAAARADRAEARLSAASAEPAVR